MTPQSRRGAVRTNRAVPWRTNPHPVFTILILMALIVGIAVGLFIGPHGGTEHPPSTSYSQTTTVEGTTR